MKEKKREQVRQQTIGTNRFFFFLLTDYYLRFCFAVPELHDLALYKHTHTNEKEERRAKRKEGFTSGTETVFCSSAAQTKKALRASAAERNAKTVGERQLQPSTAHD
jgi:hypothetical protein